MTDSTPALRALGPLELWSGGRRLPLPAPRPQLLFTHLLARADRWFRTDELVAELWPSSAPATGLRNLWTYVAQWRRALEPVRHRVWIETGRGMYRVVAERHDLDLHLFEDHIASGARARVLGDAPGAARSFGAALALWRGTPFVSLGDRASAERTRLIELHERARAGRAEALLDLPQPMRASA